MSTNHIYDNLPKEIKSKVIKDVNGLDIHYLESGVKKDDSELIILLHGFPELSLVGEKSFLDYLTKAIM